MGLRDYIASSPAKNQQVGPEGNIMSSSSQESRVHSVYYAFLDWALGSELGVEDYLVTGLAYQDGVCPHWCKAL